MPNNEYDINRARHEMDVHNMDEMDEMSQSDTSDFLDDEGKEETLKLGNLFNSFTNIITLYVSKKGTTQLYTASRYGKRFILKGLKEDYRTDPIYNLAMTKEFEIGISLEHPNIRRTIGLEHVEGLGQVIVLEYIDGQSLDSLLVEKNISIDRGRSICRQMADALDYLHRHHATHRDIKPANILVSHNGETAKVIDFNLSDSEDFIILKNPAGSRKYMAPELLMPDAKSTPESDIYSLGVVATEIAETTGDRPLKEAAKKCKAENPAERREGFQMLKEGVPEKSLPSLLSEALASRWLTYTLLAISASATAFIFFHYLTSSY